AFLKGLKTKPWVKTSLAPGSRVVTDYLEKADLDKSLGELGFHTVGYGCTTCIGNSGPLADDIRKVVESENLVVASVLSGNRNFEGRINPNVKANFLASPPLVVAYAIAGRIDIDFETEPLGRDKKGQSIMLKDIWPSSQEIQALLNLIHPEMYHRKYQDIDQISLIWNAIETNPAPVYNWNVNSTYIKNPPFFQNMQSEVEPLTNILNALPLAILGDSVTTDHISPAGAIEEDSPAADYLRKNKVEYRNFNSYGSRRGNGQVMVRGTFANIRLRNLMIPEKEGGYTLYLPTGEIKSIYDAATLYRQNQQNLIIIAGKEYGTGSSRDWAAKGTFLLGVKAVIAKSFERIHRSNLVGMGVLPLQFKDDVNLADFVDQMKEPFFIEGIDEKIQPGKILKLKQGKSEWDIICRIDTPIEIEYYKNGGILHTFLRNLI
ncbi:MAG: aconitate hydratase, partial [Deltaproteobacteria bacterium]|nr:aconitate hydratase [Deltaproteobacteria bacterium]